MSPARSLAIISRDVRSAAKNRLEDLGFKVTFSKHAEEKDEFDSSSIRSRIEDLHEAFSDDNVKARIISDGNNAGLKILCH